MKLTDTKNGIILEGNHDIFSVSNGVVGIGAAVFFLIVGLSIDHYAPAMYFLAALFGVLALLNLLSSEKDTLTINVKDKSMTLRSANATGLFNKITVVSTTKITQLQTTTERAKPSPLTLSSSDSKIRFIFLFQDASTLVFRTHRPQEIEADKRPFFSFSFVNKRGFTKSLEQDVYAPRIAKLLGVPLKTQMQSKVSKNLIITPQFRDAG